MLAEYSPEKDLRVSEGATRNMKKIVLLQSGDVGFYSGAKKLQAVLAEDADFSVRVEPGNFFAGLFLCQKSECPGRMQHL